MTLGQQWLLEENYRRFEKEVGHIRCYDIREVGLGRSYDTTDPEEYQRFVEAGGYDLCSSICGKAARLGDVGVPEDVDLMVERAIRELGGIDILVNNAGILDEAVATIDSSVKHWDEVLRVNLRGPYLCCRAAAKWMIGHGARKIVNIGSIAGIAGFAPRPSYGPSKAAVISLTRSLALEWAEYNINVNCVVPGYVRTPMIEEIFKRTGTDVGMIEKRIPFGYLASPDDIANACLFLVSDSARYITGITLPVDGGWLAYGAKSG